MNERLRNAIDRAVRASNGATLIYDLATVAANMRAIGEAARAAKIQPLFALKSFPLRAVHELAAAELAGFDAASPDEVRAACEARGDGVLSIVDPSGAEARGDGVLSIVDPSGAETRGDGVLSIVDPSGAAVAHAPRGRRVIVGCETLDQVRAVPAHCEVAIRVSASLTGRDPAIGAVLDGSGHRRSRFGVETREELAALVAAAGRRVGLHVHHGPVMAANAERFIATARAAIELLGPEPAFINLGGAWHGIADHAAAFAEIRAALGSVEIFVEPGRAYATGAGFATGRVVASREVAERIVSTVELSRVCHLRWSQPELVAPAPRADARRKVVLVGPTCYEEDVIGEWIVDPADVAERVVLGNVTGYALAWNTSFAGVPAAAVVTV